MAFLSTALGAIGVGKKVWKKLGPGGGRKVAAASPQPTGLPLFTAGGAPRVFEAPPEDYVTIDGAVTAPAAAEAVNVSTNGGSVKVLVDDEGNVVEQLGPSRRRRRRRLLTTQDKADIAFIIGTMGKGQMATSAIAQLFARRS